MARSGRPSRASGRDTGKSADTKAALVEAAIATLKDVGFAGASARTIAERAGSNQGLVFYHFGSVANLLLAALDAVSAARLVGYGAALEGIGTPAQLVDVASAIFSEDLDAGYVTVLVEMIAGASSTPGLGPEVALRIGPWAQFAQQAIEDTMGQSPLGGLLPARDVAYGIVALYLGLEMLTTLNGDREPALRLFAHARQLATLLTALGGPAPKEDTP
ncbi:MAG TPA: TetR/AcrR family transcriptional regulator [Acidimicrobiales bacterium]|jgi:AcrR family transcriptional regulator|nr:TetR/AcrR family transcriptional regulator [Acidimicrobiales bacterium]